MALTTELVASSKPEVRTQTTTTTSTSHTLPAGTWLCTLTGTVSLSSGTTSWVELDGTRATAQGVADTSFGASADMGVVLPSVTGGRSITLKASTSTALTFRAVRIG